MYERAFKRIFWGLLFILFDFRIGGFDLAPNIIGHIFLMQGLVYLEEENEFFMKVLNINKIMLVLSLFSIYEPSIDNTNVNPIAIVLLVMGIVSLLGKILLMHRFFMGAKEMTTKYNNLHMAYEAGERWVIFLQVEIATLVSFLAAYIPTFGTILIIFIAIVNIYSNIKILKFVNKCKRIDQIQVEE